MKKTRRAGEPPGCAALINIAQVYFEQGDIETAASRLSQIDQNESFMSDDREKLWLEIYQRQGESTKAADLLQQRFHHDHSVNTLNALLETIGEDKRDDVLSKEISFIFEQDELSITDADFLIAINHVDKAEIYLMKHADQLNGNLYASLLSLAEALENEHRPLVVSLIYRSLLQSILERAYAKAYTHAVCYLKKLDTLSEQIQDWERFNTHEQYKQQLMQTHGRKKRFWSKYA